MNIWEQDTGYAGLGEKLDKSIEGIAYIKTIKSLLDQRFGHMTKSQVSGTVSETEAYFLEKINATGARLLIKNVYNQLNGYVFIWNDTILDFDFNIPANHANVTVFGQNESLVLEIKKLFEEKIVTPAKQGFIFAIMRYGDSLQLQRIGYAGTALEKSNYSKKIISDYDYVVKDLKSPLPSGRISIFDGPPGTGKTYLVRSILTEVPDALFVLVPPNMVSALGGPELLPMLLQNKESYRKSGPTVFILEDADQCLVPRGPDNIDSISSILNLGDGIFGSLFDIRIVATTNAKKAEMDSAIMRAGRLSKRIEVGKLNYDEASVIFDRLLPGVVMPKVLDPEEEQHSMKPRGGDSKYSLAEVYKAARDAGWIPTGPDKDPTDTLTDDIENHDEYDEDDE